MDAAPDPGSRTSLPMVPKGVKLMTAVSDRPCVVTTVAVAAGDVLSVRCDSAVEIDASVALPSVAPLIRSIITRVDEFVVDGLEPARRP